MRELTDHKVNGLNEAIQIQVLDEPGHGGACHHYRINAVPLHAGKIPVIDIHFQNGPIQECDFNGVSQEALAAILIDRLRSFQAGPFACRENAVALTHLEAAMMWLHKRTRDRMARSVEGTNQK